MSWFQIKLALFLILLPFALLLANMILRRLVRPWLNGREELRANRCACGYELSNLDRIRCPECGNVFGFSATPEELGLSDDELRRASEARARRSAASAVEKS